jgi:putative transcriptional regulator
MELQGWFLIAMPDLLDPNFHRAVVLVLDHGDDGTLGLVVNRPGSVDLTELCASLEIEWQGTSGELLYVGGPVQPASVWMLHEGADDVPDSLSVMQGCAYSTSRGALTAIAGRPGSRRRLLGGYAGWGPGQLEGELREGAWLTCEANLDLVFGGEPDRVWERALRGVGIDPFALVPGGGELQ